MDFFEAQARAKRRTARLVWLFAAAVGGTIATTYFLVIYGLDFAERAQAKADDITPPMSLWRPEALLCVGMVTLVVVGLGSLYKWAQYASGGSAVAKGLGARLVEPHTTNTKERVLLDVVEEMSIAAGIPVPAVYILDGEQGINAFAAGLTTADAAVTVTQGTLEQLTRDELQGVIGHEMSHILNGDMRLNLRIGAIVFGILVIALSGRGVLWSLRGFRASRGKGGGQIVLFLFLVGVSLLIIGYIGYFFGRIIQAAVSRQREFLADASSVQFTRNPNGLVGALQKIGAGGAGSELDTHRSAEIGHFLFAQGFTSMFDPVWATHPPLDARIKALFPGLDADSAKRTGFIPAPVPAKMGISPPPLSEKASDLGDISSIPLVADPLIAIASVGVMTGTHIGGAARLIASIPPALRSAAQSPDGVVALLYGLVLDSEDETLRRRQQALVVERADGSVSRVFNGLDSAFRELSPEQRLPLAQLALPALRQMPSVRVMPFLATLRELVRVEGQVSMFSFALQKLVTRALSLGGNPSREGGVQVATVEEVLPEISIVLSALARTASNEDMNERAAFAAGVSKIKDAGPRLTFLNAADCGFDALDAALDKLAGASGLVKQCVVAAAAHVVGADNQILVAEAELLRAITAALDIPMPLLAAGPID